MIEILHLIDTYRIGGPGKTIINSAKWIDTTRYRIHVGAFLHPDESKNEFAHAARRAGIPLLEIREAGRLSFSYVQALRDYVRRERIRIVHPHGYRSDVFAYLATRWMPGVSLVTTHHGWIRNSRKQDLVAKAATALAGWFDGLEVVSQKLYDDLPARMRKRDTVVVVHNGIVLEDYVPAGVRATVRARFGVAPDGLAIGVVGRLSPEKGVLGMLDSFQRVLARCPRAELLFAGDGPLREEIVRRAEAVGIADKIHLPGHQDRVQELYEAIDVLAVPSHTEGISNVILECMTMGVPVVATRVGGTPEIIESERNGLLVPSKDLEAMAGAILRVIDEAGLRERLVIAGRARIEEAYSFQARMRTEEAFYQRVLAVRDTLVGALTDL